MMFRAFTLTPAAMRILGIDPGFDRLGIAVVEGDPSRPTLVMSQCFLPTKGIPADRLAQVSKTITGVVSEYAPDVLAIGTLFFSVNKKTALGVAEARGAVLAAAGLAGLPVVECTPQQVKVAVAGHGAADKKDIAIMLPKLLSLPEKRRLDDEFDAIAIGITALASRSYNP